MFPMCDVIPSRTTPAVTIGLILVNALAFLSGLRPEGFDPDPAARTVAGAAAAFDWPAAIATGFIHAGWLHLGGNMLALWIFGENVEDAMGHTLFLLFYPTSAALGVLAYAAVGQASTSLLLGASAPVAAVTAAYFVLYPRSRILVLVFLILHADVIEVPAITLFGFWVLLQLVTSAASPGSGANLAALAPPAAGAAAGALAGLVLRRRVKWTRWAH